MVSMKQGNSMQEMVVKTTSEENTNAQSGPNA